MSACRRVNDYVPPGDNCRLYYRISLRLIRGFSNMQRVRSFCASCRKPQPLYLKYDAQIYKEVARVQNAAPLVPFLRPGTLKQSAYTTLLQAHCISRATVCF